MKKNSQLKKELEIKRAKRKLQNHFDSFRSTFDFVEYIQWIQTKAILENQFLMLSSQKFSQGARSENKEEAILTIKEAEKISLKKPKNSNRTPEDFILKMNQGALPEEALQEEANDSLSFDGAVHSEESENSGKNQIGGEGVLSPENQKESICPFCLKVGPQEETHFCPVDREQVDLKGELFEVLGGSKKGKKFVVTRQDDLGVYLKTRPVDDDEFYYWCEVKICPENKKYLAGVSRFFDVEEKLFKVIDPTSRFVGEVVKVQSSDFLGAWIYPISPNNSKEFFFWKQLQFLPKENEK